MNSTKDKGRRMKDSGIEWIGEIPEDWEVFSFKNIIDYVVDNRGKTPPIIEVGIPMLEIDALTNRYPDTSKVTKFLSQETYDNFLRKYLKAGDILFATVGSIGKTSIVPNEFDYCIAQNIVGFRPNHNQDNLFWFFYLSSEAFRLTYMQYNKGNIQESIKISNLMGGKVVSPSLNEQEKIANFLDQKVAEIDHILEKTKESIEEYKKYKQSIITEAATKGLNPDVEMKDSGIEWIGEIPKEWKVVRLKNIGICFGGITYNPNDICDEGEGVLVLRSSNVQNGNLDFNDNVYVNMNISEKFITRKGDILVCSRNGSRNLIGKNALIDGDYGYTFGAFMTIVRTKYHEFVHYFLNSDIFKAQSSLFLTSTVNQLTIGTFNNMNLVMPNEDEQQQIVSYLDDKCSEIDSLIAQKEQLLLDLESYKKSLIYECVTGKRQIS